ncbi:SLOG family protein [Bosea sp. 2YAB26]|uniref:SLOG family protein n=1 Tax=Bosea sp. 2YAB26 TaxID=3237478 RepID=UPI003F93D4CB
MTTAIICGGRSYGIMPRDFHMDAADRLRALARHERGRLYVIMRSAIERLNATRFVMGDATGADCLAAGWCRENGIEFKVYAADWQQHGNAAGPIRNAAMLEAENPHFVIAFPGSKGTRNMCGLAEKAGVTVHRIDWA